MLYKYIHIYMCMCVCVCVYVLVHRYHREETSRRGSLRLINCDAINHRSDAMFLKTEMLTLYRRSIGSLVH